MGYPPVGASTGFSPSPLPSGRSVGDLTNAPEFATEADRDKFYTDNPGNKIDGTWAVVDSVRGKTGAQLQRWKNSQWNNMATFLKGDKGEDGVTPTIGVNGNWFVGSRDTGVPARGDISNAIVGVSISGDVLTFTHGDGSKHAITIPVSSSEVSKQFQADLEKAKQDLAAQGVKVADLETKYGPIVHELGVLTSFYSYTGATAPSYPTQKGKYFTTLSGAVSPTLTVTMPASAISGVMYTVYNDNANTVARLQGEVGVTVGGDQYKDVPAKTGMVFGKSGTDWVLLSTISLNPGRFLLTGDAVAEAMARGQVDDNKSLSSAGNGWWYVPESLTGVTSKPLDTKGDLILFKQIVKGNNRIRRGIMMVYGLDVHGHGAIWIRYKVTDSWGSWIKLVTAGDVISDLENKVSTLQNTVDNLPTPITEEEIEKALKGKGWGPLSGGMSGGGSDLPPLRLPKIVAMFHDSIPTSLTENSAVTSTNGKATLHRAQVTPVRIWVLVENNNDEASKVKSIAINDGIPAVWQPRDLVIDGDKYRGFYSAGSYTETEATVKVNFG